MLRQLIIGLMKVLLDLQIILSLIVGVLVIASTSTSSGQRTKGQTGWGRRGLG
jgi:hypothetical protein